VDEISRDPSLSKVCLAVIYGEAISNFGGTEKRLFVYNPEGLTQTSNIRSIFAFGGAFH
jgi:hypothetical protein